MMELTESITNLRAFNSWRRDDGDIDQPDPREVGLAIDALCNHAERMGRELTELRKNGSALIASLQTELDGVERELEQERQDRKQADLDTIRALGERNDARTTLMLAAEWGISSDGFSAEVSSAIRCWIIGGMQGPPPKAPDYYPKRAGDSLTPTHAEIDAYLDECAARSERDWRPLDGDPDELCPPPTDQERRANARAIHAMTPQERFALMFGGKNDTYAPPADR